MSRKQRTMGLCFFIIMGSLWSSAADAFDGNRKGFFLEIGAGPGFQNSTQYYTTSSRNLEIDNSDFALSINSKLGYGLSERLLVSMTTNMSSINGESVFTKLLSQYQGEDSRTMTLSIAGIGVTYYLTDVAPFPFVDVTLGLSNWDDMDIDGPGIAVGVGAEFKPNWSAAVDLGWGNPKEGPDIVGIEWEVTGVTVGTHVSHIWY